MKGDGLRERLKDSWPYLFVVAATLVVTREWWNTGMLAGHSAYMDFYRQIVLDAAVREGDVWPRFAEAFYAGHGSLLFHFYAPLTYWITELFVLLGAGVPVAIKLTHGLTILLSGLFAALLARELFGPWAAAAAGTYYVMAPYHLTDVLARHAFGEAVAFAWLPLALWGILGAVRDRSPGRMAAGAIGCAFLLLTHNITAMITAPLLAAWWIFLTIRHRGEGYVGPLYGALAGLWGLLLAAFFWLPAIAETGFVQSKRSLTQGYFVYWDHFVYLKQFFSLTWGHGGSRAGLDDTMSFQLGLAHWVGLAASIWVLVWSQKWRGTLFFWWGALLASLAMCHAVSEPMWRLIPLLAFVQFPWRFLLPAALAASLVAAPVAQWLAEHVKQGVGLGLALCFIALPLVTYFPYTYAKHLLYNREQQRFRGYRQAAYDQRVKKKQFARPADEFGIEHIRNTRINATARDDFLPAGVKLLPRRPAANRITAPRGTVTDIERVGPRRYRAQVTMRETGDLQLHRFWYPGWRARVNGVDLTTAAGDRDGLVNVTLPAGDFDVEFWFGSTKLRAAAWLVSALGLLGLAITIIMARMRRKET
ncbi:MAG: hypothetical protein P9L99_02960 [Candidatus Lernaella stagnicola]|nr:hypothetical protein [Candidatus Lernaella stagnicola]